MVVGEDVAAVPRAVQGVGVELGVVQVVDAGEDAGVGPPGSVLDPTLALTMLPIAIR